MNSLYFLQLKRLSLFTLRASFWRCHLNLLCTLLAIFLIRGRCILWFLLIDSLLCWIIWIINLSSLLSDEEWIFCFITLGICDEPVCSFHLWILYTTTLRCPRVNFWPSVYVSIIHANIILLLKIVVFTGMWIIFLEMKQRQGHSLRCKNGRYGWMDANVIYLEVKYLYHASYLINYIIF